MKQPKPWFRASKNAWYVEHNLKQIRLGEHPENAPPPKKSKNGWNAPKEIQDAFYRLMVTDPATLPKPVLLTLRWLADLFLEHSHTHHAKDTYDNYKFFLQSFCDAYPTLMAAEVKPFHVSRWLDSKPTWKGGKRHGIIAVCSAFSWADKQGVLSPSPLQRLKAERAKRRTRILSPEEMEEILANIKDKPFKQFMQAMLETGCRPSEIARVTAEMVDLKIGVWRFPEHKKPKRKRTSPA